MQARTARTARTARCAPRALRAHFARRAHRAARRPTPRRRAQGAGRRAHTPRHAPRAAHARMRHAFTCCRLVWAYKPCGYTWKRAAQDVTFYESGAVKVNDNVNNEMCTATKHFVLALGVPPKLDIFAHEVKHSSVSPRMPDAKIYQDPGFFCNAASEQTANNNRSADAFWVCCAVSWALPKAGSEPKKSLVPAENIALRNQGKEKK